jgi:hypothetical protein
MSKGKNKAIKALVFLGLYGALSHSLWASSDVAVYIPLEMKGRCLSSMEPGPLIQSSPDGESAAKVAKRECGKVAKRCLIRSGSSENKDIALAKVITACGESGSITVYDVGFGETPAEAQENAKKMILSSLNPPWVKQKKHFDVEILEYQGSSNPATQHIVKMRCGNALTEYEPKTVITNHEIVKVDWIGSNSNVRLSTSVATLIKSQDAYQNQANSNKQSNDDTVLFTVKGRDISYGGLKIALASVGCILPAANQSEDEENFSRMKGLFLYLKGKAKALQIDYCRENPEECEKEPNSRHVGTRG